MLPSEYAKYDGLELAELVRRGEVQPSELVDAAIARIEEHNPRLNAVVLRMDEEARRTLCAPLPDGAFRGVPFLLKDVEEHYAGFPTSAGTRVLKDLVRERDSELTLRFKDAGFIVLGKTNVPELAIKGVTESKLWGPARNPWNLARTTGGSSGGAAAAVAARIVPIAHGSDGGGSIRIPCSMTGLFGLKPTRARTPHGPGVGEVWCGLSVGHALTRSVRDSAAVLDALCGPDLGAPYFASAPERPFADEVGAPPGRLRIAVSDTPLFGRRTHAYCSAALWSSARLCEELGHEVVQVAPRFDRNGLVRAYLLVVAANVAADVRDMARLVGHQIAPDELEDATWALCAVGEHLSAGELLDAIRVYQAEARSIAGFFESCDVFMTPTIAQPVPLIGAFEERGLNLAVLKTLKRVAPGKLLDLVLERAVADNPMLEAFSNTMLWNLTGQPAATLPLHWDPDGMPVGTQLVARYGDEATLFCLSAQLEAARPWADKRPAGV